MAVSRHLGCEPTGSSIIRSAIPKNPTLEPNTKLIGSPIAEIWRFEFYKMVASRHLGFSWIWRAMKCFLLLVMT